VISVTNFIQHSHFSIAIHYKKNFKNCLYALLMPYKRIIGQCCIRFNFSQFQQLSGSCERKAKYYEIAKKNFHMSLFLISRMDTTKYGRINRVAYKVNMQFDIERNRFLQNALLAELILAPPPSFPNRTIDRCSCEGAYIL
jgi:hypothetical protein